MNGWANSVPYVNPLTNSATCPPGYATYQVGAYAFPDAPHHDWVTGLYACFVVPPNAVYTAVIGGMYQTCDAG